MFSILCLINEVKLLKGTQLVGYCSKTRSKSNKKNILKRVSNEVLKKTKIL